MKFGLAFFATDTTLDPVSFARAAEERGFESVWLPEHSHIPTSRITPWGGVPDAPPLPEHYSRTYDSFVALAAAAAATSTIRLATGITLVAQRDPVWTAKEVASLDRLSGGRFIFGIGYGWNREEMASHGVDYHQRRALVREKILAMKALWTQEEAKFHGDHVRLEPSWAWPKPIQVPHPPIVLGAAPGPRTVRDIVELCDGWMPLGRYDIRQGTGVVTEALRKSGRDTTGFELTNFGSPATPEHVKEMTELGFHRLLFSIPSVEPAKVIELLDDRARFAESLRS